jgi:RNA polymerase primary sigma factor
MEESLTTTQSSFRNLFHEAKGKAFPDQQQSVSMIDSIKEGDTETRNELIMKHLLLVADIANDYIGQIHTLNMEDLFTAGVCGLCNAIDHYDSSKGVKFATYASYWIRHDISQAIRKEDRAVHVPVYAWDDYRRIKKAIEELGTDDPKTLAGATGISPDRIKKLKDAFTDPMSMEEDMSEEEPDSPLSLYNTLESNVYTPEETYLQKEAEETLDHLMDCLTDRERIILELRNGFNGEKPMTLAAIGDQFGLTRERIRQIELKAMEKMSLQYKKYQKENA